MLKRMMFAVMLVSAVVPQVVQAAPVARTVLVPLSYDVPVQMFTVAHQNAEAILNYQGLKVEYIGPDGPYPDLKTRPDVRGILSWLPGGAKIVSPEAYYNWLASSASMGRKVVLMGELLPVTKDEKPATLKQLNSVLKPLGFETDGSWEANTYLFKETTGAEGFETAIPNPIPASYRIQSTADDVQPLMVFEHPDAEEPYLLGAAVSPRGGFALEGVALIETGDEDPQRRWIIDPFTFFAKAFDTASLPKPDVTTLDGTRMYLSHIDGDGWRSITQLEKYRGKLVTNAEVLYQDILQKTPDLPTSVAPIAAEVDPAWSGTPQTQEIVKKMFALPQVEPSSHTYSHPFSWDFYSPKYFQPTAEDKFERRYPQCGRGQAHAEYTHGELGDADNTDVESSEDLLTGYTLPRAFGCKPVTAERETVGAAEYISQLAPEGKKVELVQWSGNTRPFHEVLEATTNAGLAHINGGQTRLDSAFASYAHVSPIGINKGKYWQVYAPMSNENTYTNLWSGPYHGYRYLRQTLANTGMPYRMKPFNVYYHTYSAEKDASIKSLDMVLEYIRQQEIIPVKTSTFARMAQNFYTTEMAQEGGKWVIRNRGMLQTIRFDDATFKKVDFANSTGVIGQRHFAGSLYVALDPNVKTPSIALVENETAYLNPSASQAYVIASRWPLSKFSTTANAAVAEAAGYGEGTLKLRLPVAVTATVRLVVGSEAKDLRIATKGEDNVLEIPLRQTGAMTPTRIEVAW